MPASASSSAAAATDELDPAAAVGFAPQQFIPAGLDGKLVVRYTRVGRERVPCSLLYK